MDCSPTKDAAVSCQALDEDKTLAGLNTGPIESREHLLVAGVKPVWHLQVGDVGIGRKDLGHGERCQTLDLASTQ
jgi:hypothetical protein